MYHASDHPRNPKGTPTGGQFAPKTGVGTDQDLQFGEVLPETEQRMPFDWAHVNQRPVQSAVRVRKRSIGTEYTFYDGVQRFLPSDKQGISAQYVSHDVQINLADNASETSWRQALQWATQAHSDIAYWDMELKEARTIAEEQRQWLSRNIDTEVARFKHDNADRLSDAQKEQLERFHEGCKREHASALQLHSDADLHLNRVRAFVRSSLDGGAWEDMYRD